jgi:uncharacterized membrane protein YkgB
MLKPMQYPPSLIKLDQQIISVARRAYLPFSRFALFLVYFWFGILKVFGQSPANPLVASLQAKTLPFLSFDQFIVLFGLFEMLIGILFLIPKATRVALPLLAFHMVTTIMPLFLLPAMTWTMAPFVPSMEGQYIIKNILIISLGIVIASQLTPCTEEKKPSAQ